MLFLCYIKNSKSVKTYFSIKKVRWVDKKMQMERWRENQAFGEIGCLNATEYNDDDIRFSELASVSIREQVIILCNIPAESNSVSKTKPN